MSVKRCQSEVDSREFQEWRAFDSVDPIGDDRFDVLAAMIATHVKASGGGMKGERVRVKPPQWGQKERPTQEAMYAKAESARLKLSRNGI